MSAMDDQRLRWRTALAVRGFSQRMAVVGRRRESEWARKESLRVLDSWSDAEILLFWDGASSVSGVEVAF